MLLWRFKTDLKVFLPGGEETVEESHRVRDARELFSWFVLDDSLERYPEEQSRANLECFLVLNTTLYEFKLGSRTEERRKENGEREDGYVRRSQEEKQSSCVSCKSRDSIVSVLSHGERWKKERERERERDWREWVTEDAEDGVSYVHLLISEASKDFLFVLVCEPRRKVRENVVSVCYREAV